MKKREEKAKLIMRIIAILVALTMLLGVINVAFEFI
jgi:predicted nucleic acid-binding Zn ribbon protein